MTGGGGGLGVDGSRWGGAWRRVGWFCDDRLVRTGRGGPDLSIGVKRLSGGRNIFR